LNRILAHIAIASALVVTLMFQSAQGQVSLSGLITDSSNAPLEYTTVTIKKDTSHVKVAITDPSGKFKTDNLDTGIYILTLTRLGYLEKTMEIRLVENLIFSCILQKDYKVLDNVTIIAKEELRRTADRFIYTPNKILTEGSTAAELLRQVPLIRYEEKDDVISLIGRTGTKVYINNRNTEIPSEMLAGILRSMPATNIKSIDLITNPGSEYAANTTGGVININLKRLINEGWLGTLTFYSSQGYSNFSSINGFLNYRKGKITLQVVPSISNNYNSNSTDASLIYSSGDKTVFNSRSFRRYQVYGNALKLDYDINKKNYLSYNGWFSFVKGKTNRNTFSDYSKETQNYIDSSEILNTIGKDKFIYNYGNVNYHKSIDADKKYLDLNIYYNHFYQRRENTWTNNDSKQFGNDLPQKFLNFSAKLLHKQNIGESASFMSGFQVSSTKTDNNQTYYNLAGNGLSDVHYKYDEKYYAVFGSLSKSFSNKINTKVGLRLETTDYSTEELKKSIKSDSTYVSLFPDAGLSFSIDDKNDLSLNFSRKITRPNIELLFPGRLYISNTYFSQNNPFLQPVFLNRFDFTYTFKRTYILSLAYQTTRNNYANFIVPVVENGASLLKRTYLNYGNSQNFSVAINFRQPVNRIWNFYFTSSYNHAEYDGKVPDVPIKTINNSFALYINNTVYISQKRNWTAFATFNYSSPTTEISGKKNGYSTLDVEIKKVIKNFSVSVRATDIYNGSANIKYKWFPNSLLKENIQFVNSYPRYVAIRMIYTFGNNKVQSAKNRSQANDEIRNRIN
jgi:hypothetical protein